MRNLLRLLVAAACLARALAGECHDNDDCSSGAFCNSEEACEDCARPRLVAHPRRAPRRPSTRVEELPSPNRQIPSRSAESAEIKTPPYRLLPGRPGFGRG